MAPVLPIIDFGPFLDPEASLEAKKNVAFELDRACRDVGFFYLKNHGVSLELMTAMLDSAREFFETASPEEKERIALRKTAEGGDNARGWLSVRKPDAGSHEAVDFYRPVEATGPPYITGMGPNKWPSTPPNLKELSETYVEKVTSLGNSVMKAIAMGLGVDDEIFLSRINKAFWNLRILGYEGRKSKSKENAGIGQHTDFGILTFLLTDSTKNSLQVLDKTGEWIWADPIEGCYVCNIGDMLSEWTRNAYKSTLHRVCHNSDSLRISIPLFFDPNWDAFISPVISPGNGESDEKTRGIRYSDTFIRSVEKPLWRDPLTPPDSS
ncbi:oxoglutarate 3-dioxygenase [Hypoxylon fuscum]|nr:oxoglutarate 3-dioxygenase [Hypoxylon fuscum]